VPETVVAAGAAVWAKPVEAKTKPREKVNRRGYGVGIKAGNKATPRGASEKWPSFAKAMEDRGGGQGTATPYLSPLPRTSQRNVPTIGMDGGQQRERTTRNQGTRVFLVFVPSLLCCVPSQDGGQGTGTPYLSPLPRTSQRTHACVVPTIGMGGAFGERRPTFFQAAAQHRPTIFSLCPPFPSVQEIRVHSCNGTRPFV